MEKPAAIAMAQTANLKRLEDVTDFMRALLLRVGLGTASVMLLK
jgi:hypothetical protein